MHEAPTLTLTLTLALTLTTTQVKAGLDGAYTYFASDGFTEGAPSSVKDTSADPSPNAKPNPNPSRRRSPSPSPSPDLSPNPSRRDERQVGCGAARPR
jgi:hypothetical protein